ncbi:MAG: PD-(D/E)XK nuclease family protein, partial [Clostridia bacterium]
FLSYSSSDMEGKSLRPSVLVSRIKKIFEGIKETSDVIYRKSEISTKENTFKELLINLREFRDGNEIDAKWFDVFNLYNESEEWHQMLASAVKALNYTNTAEKIKKENVEKMYGSTLKTSVSKLEKYGGCPFSYYLKYGLKLNDKETFNVEAVDTGSFMHDVIDNFFGVIEERNINLKEITDEELEKIVAEIVSEKLKLDRNYIFTTTSKYKVLSNRLQKVVTMSVKYIVQSLKQSEFEVFGHEVEFGGKGQYKPITVTTDDGRRVEIIGKIDRVDIMKNPDGTYVRIIDYKSSVKNIDLNQVFYGLQLQLLTYLNETCKVEDFIPAGVLYFNLINPTIGTDKNLTDEEVEEKIRQEFKMKGLILADVNIIKKMDTNIENEPKGISKIIPATIKKDGEISDRGTSAVTKEQFVYLQKYMEKIIKQISEEILQGNIEVKPYYNASTKKTPCEYCKYKSICRFDENTKNNEYKYISKLNKDAVLEMIKNKVV